MTLSQQLLQLRDQLRYREEQLRAAMLENSTLRHQLAGIGPAPLSSMSDPAVRPRPEVSRRGGAHSQGPSQPVMLLARLRDGPSVDLKLGLSRGHFRHHSALEP